MYYFFISYGPIWKNTPDDNNQIGNTILKNMLPITIILIMYTYNVILRLFYFPTTWKSAVFIPILKPKIPTDKVDSFRLFWCSGNNSKKTFLQEVIINNLQIKIT